VSELETKLKASATALEEVNSQFAATEAKQKKEQEAAVKASKK
jgi:hypothetical protein